MITKILYREYNYPNNVISATQGSSIITGTGTKFTEMPIGVYLEAEGYGYLGKVLTVESDTSLTLEVEASYSCNSVVWWQDWTMYRIENNVINRKVESDNPGESGVIVFDNVSITLYMGDALNIGGIVYNNPVKAAFGGDIDSKKRFIIKIAAINYDYSIPDNKLIDSSYNRIVDNAGNYITAHYKSLQSRLLYEGVVDFTTISMPSLTDDNGETFDTITFELVDKLSAINSLATAETRVKGYMNPSVTGSSDIDQIRYYKWWDRTDMGIYYTKDEGGGVYSGREINDINAPMLGDLIQLNFFYGQSAADTYNGLITFKYLHTAQDPPYGRMYYNIYTDYSDWTTGTTDQDKLGSCDSTIRTASTQKWIDSLFNNENIFITQTSTKDIRLTTGIIAITGTEIIAIDGLLLIKAILKQRWPDFVLINKLKDGIGVQITTFPLPLDFIFQLLDEFPFGKEPLEALSYVVNAIDCYLFTDINGNFVLQNHKSFDHPEVLPAITVIDLDHTLIKTATKKIFWDKLVDSVVVNVTSWIKDNTGVYIDGIGYAFKVTGIKPRNEMTKDVIIDKASLDRYGITINADGTLSHTGHTTQAEILNYYGDSKAAEKMEFYGKRHESYEITMVKLTWDMLIWELLFLYNYNSKSYFLTNMSIDIDESTIEFLMPSVQGYEYNLDNVIIGKQRDEYLAGN